MLRGVRVFPINFYSVDSLHDAFTLYKIMEIESWPIYLYRQESILCGIYTRLAGRLIRGSPKRSYTKRLHIADAPSYLTSFSRSTAANVMSSLALKCAQS